MKKYFVRAIPREGNIVSGDYVFFKINGKWTGPADFDSMLGPQIEDVRRAVFYLCSRDIKVGDIATEMLDNGGFQDFEIHTENDIYPEFIKDGFQFKLLGPVSLDALQWVNEDDEFDDKEVTKHFTMTMKDQSPEDAFYYQLKCPKCKRFH